jgi:peptide/nickel transport system permease protein
MVRYLGARLLSLLLVLLLSSGVVFLFTHLIPGDPVVAILGSEADEATREGLRHALGLDRPLTEQYTRWLLGFLKGDWGRSVRTGQPVYTMVVTKLPVTLELTGAAVTVGLCIALPLGAVAALQRNTLVDLGAMTVSFIGVSIPPFWLGVILILLFSLYWKLLPSIGYVPPFHDPLGAIRHMVLPALTLGVGLAASLTRMVRSDILEELSRDYVRTARAKGVKLSRILIYHVARNALLPTLTILGVQVSALLGGAVVTEQIFAWPGVGQLIVQGVSSRDYPTLQAAILVVTTLVALVQLLIDIAYALMNPQIRYE